MSHTPEPWSINDWLKANTDISIGAIGTPLIARIPLRYVSMQKANARRIVACVNVCSGIPTDRLEYHLSASVTMLSMLEQAVSYMDQRDELLDVLTEYIAAADNSMNPPEGDDIAAMLRFAEADKSARAAIAKAESEQ